MTAGQSLQALAKELAGFEELLTATKCSVRDARAKRTAERLPEHIQTIIDKAADSNERGRYAILSHYPRFDIEQFLTMCLVPQVARRLAGEKIHILDYLSDFNAGIRSMRTLLRINAHALDAAWRAYLLLPGAEKDAALREVSRTLKDLLRYESLQALANELVGFEQLLKQTKASMEDRHVRRELTRIPKYVQIIADNAGFATAKKCDEIQSRYHHFDAWQFQPLVASAGPVYSTSQEAVTAYLYLLDYIDGLDHIRKILRINAHALEYTWAAKLALTQEAKERNIQSLIQSLEDALAYGTSKTNRVETAFRDRIGKCTNQSLIVRERMVSDEAKRQRDFY
ncbi:hypothetical protein H4R34_000344 [Dimargaris verticillata]|uniref:Uncharacterized protein n=1 Tax=Dimargaris verticillata TaxID=2761393 RepID=A0A9W8EFZ6_9FUNG|nr:hypothetical protein H4R34_000344 [Dimargaris verticillata]